MENYEKDLYIRVDTTNCETTCDDNHDNYYVKDDSNTKCINCKKNSESTDTTIKTKVYHYIDENECIVDPGNGYYSIDSKISENLDLWKHNIISQMANYKCFLYSIKFLNKNKI